MRNRILIFIMIVLIVACAVASSIKNKPRATSFITPLVFFRLNDGLDYARDSLDLPKVFREVVETQKQVVKAANFANAMEIQLVLFETLNTVDQLIKRIPYPLDIKYVYGVAGSDLMANKAYLASMLYKTYGNDANKLIPQTFILDKSGEMERLEQNYDESAVYILKKNVQRQEGYLMTKSLDEIKRVAHEYVVCQKMLQDPYLIGKRKINMRVYLLVVVKNGQVSFFYFNDGFMYYTPKHFEANSLDPDHVITTGYIDRSVYTENPMTFRDLELYLGSSDYDKLMLNIHILMKKIKMAYQERLKYENASVLGTKFLVYGCDIAPDTELRPQLMEINKGPDLNYKDERDKAVKFTMVQQMMNMVGITTGASDSFIRV